MTGEVGCGKTAAVRAAVAGLDPSRHTLIYLPNPQIGVRGSFLGNAGVPSAARIVPELQQVQAGGIFAMTPGAQDRFVVRVAGPRRARVLGGDAGQMSWAFVPGPAGERSTRLIARSRGTTGRVALGLMLKVFWHPLHVGMQRRQLLNLNRLVETA